MSQFCICKQLVERLRIIDPGPDPLVMYEDPYPHKFSDLSSICVYNKTLGRVLASDWLRAIMTSYLPQILDSYWFYIL